MQILVDGLVARQLVFHLHALMITNANAST